MTVTSTVLLREVTEGDLAVFFEHQLDPDANRMAAFTAKDPPDRDAFTAHWTKILGDDGITIRNILVAGGVAGYVLSYGWFGEPEISHWIGKEYWGRGISKSIARTEPEWIVRSEFEYHPRITSSCGS